MAKCAAAPAQTPIGSIGDKKTISQHFSFSLLAVLLTLLAASPLASAAASAPVPRTASTHTFLPHFTQTAPAKRLRAQQRASQQPWQGRRTAQANLAQARQAQVRQAHSNPALYPLGHPARLHTANPMSTPAARPQDVPPSGTHNFGGFLTAPSYQTIPQPDNDYNSVLVTLSADFNKDGSADIATLDTDGNLNIMLNDKKGHFAAPITNSSAPTVYGGSVYFIGAIVADVDGDGYPDVIAKPWVSAYGTYAPDATINLAIFHNNHDGTFATPTTLAVLQGDPINVGAFLVTDVNGDGTPDLVSAVSQYDEDDNYSTITVQTFLGQGGGKFNIASPAQTVFTYSGYNIGIPNNGILYQSLNNKPNLVIEGQAYDDADGGLLAGTSILALPGKGDGTFNAATSIEVDFTASYGEITDNTGGLSLTDLNNDGNPDITLNFGDDYVYTALGLPDGTFGAPQVAVNIFAINPAGWGVVDVNGDGLPDFIDNDVYYTAVFLGNGDGTFAPPTIVYASDENGTTTSENYPGSNFAAADFDNDGHMDFAVVSSTSVAYNRAAIYINRGDGTFFAAPGAVPANDPNTFPSAIDGVGAFDMNGDGFTDFLAQDEMGNGPYPYVAGLSDGKGGFTWKQAMPPDPGGLGNPIVQQATGDFNADGLRDVIFTTSSGRYPSNSSSLAIALSNGDGTFATPVPINMGSTTISANFYGVTAGDLNGDGKDDIVAVAPASRSPGGIVVALSNGDGTFQPAKFVTIGVELDAVAIGDFNNDGKADLIVADAGGSSGTSQVTILYGDGAGNFDPSNSFVLQSGYDITTILAKDLNADGKTDIVVVTDGQISGCCLVDGTEGVLVYLNTPNGYQLTGTYEQGHDIVQSVLGDFNGDGALDLFDGDYNEYTNAFYGAHLLLGNGDGTFGPPIEVPISPASAGLYPGNYFNDGALDMITESAYGTSMLLLNQGGTAISLTNSSPTITAGENAIVSASILPTMPYRPTAGGSLIFTENGSIVGASDVVSGQAVLTTSELAVGSHTLTAAYSGDANFNPNVNAGTVQIAVTAPVADAPSFSMLAGSATVTITRGSAQSVALTLSANSTYTGTVSLAVSGPLNGLAAQVSPATVTLAPGQTASATLLLNSVTVKSANHPAGPWQRASGGLSLACLIGILLPLRRKKLRQMLMVALALAAMAGIAGLSGCGGGLDLKTAPSGTSTLVVTATPSVQGVAPQSATISVTVQ